METGRIRRDARSGGRRETERKTGKRRDKMKMKLNGAMCASFAFQQTTFLMKIRALCRGNEWRARGAREKSTQNEEIFGRKVLFSIIIQHALL